MLRVPNVTVTNYQTSVKLYNTKQQLYDIDDVDIMNQTSFQRLTLSELQITHVNSCRDMHSTDN